jgi:hypothetical protein
LHIVTCDVGATFHGFYRRIRSWLTKLFAKLTKSGHNEAGWDEVDDALTVCQEWAMPEVFYAYMMCQDYEGLTDTMIRQVTRGAELESGKPLPPDQSSSHTGKGRGSPSELAAILAPLAASLQPDRGEVAANTALLKAQRQSVQQEAYCASVKQLQQLIQQVRCDNTWRVPLEKHVHLLNALCKDLKVPLYSEGDIDRMISASQ